MHVVLSCEIVKDHLCNLATIHSDLVILCICLILDFYFKFIFIDMFLKYVCLFAIQGILHGTLCGLYYNMLCTRLGITSQAS